VQYAGGGQEGGERKAFMSECLKAGAPAAPMTQQEKVKVCNTKAGEKKGDERKHPGTIIEILELARVRYNPPAR
jgi:hypothetical protein